MEDSRYFAEIYEVLVVTEAIHGHVLAGADGITIRRAAIEAGMETLRSDGNDKVLDGITTVEEVLAAT
jgi:type II secretory ATPase GspE/PulE/Tfp pilus assembly ATPase PilB-like protein